MNVVVSHWSANVAALVCCLVVAAVHLRGMFRTAAAAGRSGPRPGRLGQAAAFHGGLLLILMAVVSPVGYWAQSYIWVRSLQDLLLAVAAPSLIVLGAPWLALSAGLGRRPGQDGERQAPGWRWWPVTIAVVFSVVWYGWHVPALYDAALHYPGVYAAQDVLYLGVGVAFWLQLIGSGPLRPRLAPLQRVMLVAGTVVADTVLAMVLAFGPGLLYPAYLGAAHRVAPVIADQQVGGAVLWVLALPPYVIAGVALLIRWLNEEESKAVADGFDRLLTAPKSAWPSRPGWR